MTTTTHEVSTTRSIKQSLSSHFNHKFSVRQGKGSSRYIYIKWEDGPSWDQVHEFCRKYNDDGKDDLMTDLQCGSQYTIEHRSYSDKYCGVLNCDMVLYDPPDLKEQIEKYFRYLCIYPMYGNSLSMFANNKVAEINNDRGKELYYIEVVKECLSAQGYIVEVSKDKSKLLAYVLD